MKSFFNRAAAFVFAISAFAASAGGPLGVCSAGTQIKYPGAGSVTFNYDRGTLGTRSNAAAATIVNNAIAMWNNVATATVTLTRGADLPVDVTTANMNTYLGNGTFGDGINPVVYDTDGTITDAMLGSGAHTNVLGFAGSAYSTSPCQYVEGRAVINGAIGVSDATMTTVLTHELGHFIGLDHTQLDGMQGLATSNYPLMYPVAYRSAAGLHEDDIASVSALYPDATVATTYGTLTGNFRTAGGTAILGANIWARNTTTGQLFSVVSDYLMQGTGYFKLLLPPGTYTLNAEAIDRSFTGGSGVGPYSDDLTGASFQAPLYSGTTAMADVTMSPQVTINAGCTANVAFSITGSGTVTGNCASSAPVASTMTSPTPGSTLTGASAVFTWTQGSGQTARYLSIGTTQGGQDLYSGYVTSMSSVTLNNLPTDGRTIYVDLGSYMNGAWTDRLYTYTAYSAAAVPSQMLSPGAGTVLAGSTVTFTWNAGSRVSARYLSVGTTLGGSQIYGADQGTALSRTVTNLPTNGGTVYVRLTSTINGVAQSNDYTYIAANVVASAMSAITSPTPGSTLTGSPMTLTWSAGSGVTTRYLIVGTTQNGQDLFSNYVNGTLSQSVTVPTAGQTIYVQLSSYINGAWQTASATYTAANGTATPPPAPTPTTGMSLITAPTSGSTLTGGTLPLAWTAGTGVTTRYLIVGSSLNGQDLFSNYVNGTLSQAVTVPTDGRTIYVQLSSYINGAWQTASASYVAASGGSTPAPTTSAKSLITTPAGGTTLAGSTVTFGWTAGSGWTYRYLTVGTTPGGQDLFSNHVGSAASQSVSGIPRGSRTIYVRLQSYINGAWQYDEKTYTSAP